MKLQVENLMPGTQRAVYRTQSQGLDLSRYSNLRMFTHLDGVLASGERLHELPIDVAREKVRIFIRLGANETNDYYEYEMPLVPSDPVASVSSNDADQLWMTNQNVGGTPVDLNSVNLVLSALNLLKVERDKMAAPTDSVFWSNEHDVTLSCVSREKL